MLSLWMGLLLPQRYQVSSHQKRVGGQRWLAGSFLSFSYGHRSFDLTILYKAFNNIMLGGWHKQTTAAWEETLLANSANSRYTHLPFCPPFGSSTWEVLRGHLRMHSESCADLEWGLKQQHWPRVNKISLAPGLLHGQSKNGMDLSQTRAGRCWRKGPNMGT